MAGLQQPNWSDALDYQAAPGRGDRHTGDLGLLERRIADDCWYVNSTGDLDTERGYLDKLTRGVIRYPRSPRTSAGGRPRLRWVISFRIGEEVLLEWMQASVPQAGSGGLAPWSRRHAERLYSGQSYPLPYLR